MQRRCLRINGVERDVLVVSRGGEVVVDDYGATWRIVGDAPAGSVDAQEEPVIPSRVVAPESPPKPARSRGRKR